MERLKKVEKETIVNFNEADGRADVYTYNNAWIKKLLRWTEQFPNEVRLERSECYGGYTFSVPKNYIKLQAPRKYSAEQKSAMKKRLLSNLGRKSSTSVEEIDGQIPTEGKGIGQP